MGDWRDDISLLELEAEAELEIESEVAAPTWEGSSVGTEEAPWRTDLFGRKYRDVPTGDSPTWGDAAVQVGKGILKAPTTLGGLMLDTAYTLSQNLFGKPVDPKDMYYFTRKANQMLDTLIPNRVGGEVVEYADAALGGALIPEGQIANAVAGLSSEGAAKIFPESTLAPYAGAVVPASVGGVAKAAARAVNPKRMAGKALVEAAGKEGADNINRAFQNNATEGVAGPLTYAEMAGTPSAAAYQQAVRKVPGTGDVIEQALAERQVARIRELQSIAPDALQGKTAAERGAAIQPKAARIAKSEIQAANNLYKLIPEVGGIDISGVKASAAIDAAKKFAKSPLPMESETGRILQFLGRETPNSVSLSELTAIKQAAGRVIGKLSRVDKNAPEIGLLETISKGLDDATQQAVDAGVIPKDAAMALETARSTRAAAGQKFSNSTVRSLWKKGDYGVGFKTEAEKVVQKATTSASAARKVMKAYGNDPSIVQNLRGGLLDQMSADGTRGFASWPRYFKQRSETFKEIFGQDVDKVRAVIEDIASEKSVEEMASRASRGQSATTQFQTAARKLLVDGPGALLRAAGNLKVGGTGAAGVGLATGNPIAAGATLAASMTAKQLAKRMEQWVAKGMADPEILQMLAGKATESNIKTLQSRFLGALGAGEIVAGEGISQKAGLFNPSPDPLFEVGAPSYEPNMQSEIDALIEQLEVKKKDDAMKGYDAIIEQLKPALVKQESAGKADAVSSKGAMGLWQLMPATFDEWSKKLGIKNADPFNPEHSEKVGRAYLNHMLELFGGDPALALAGYNAGPYRVKSLMKEHGSSIMDIYRYLPKETQQYVNKILTDSGLA